MNQLSFTCLSCGLTSNQSTAQKGCDCGASLFKVARILFHDPYRETSDNEDGYKVNNPGTQGEIGESGLGSTRFRRDEAGYDEFMANNYIPKDGSPYDDFGVPGNSDKMFSGPEGDYNPLEQVNQGKEPLHVGPHNMTDLTQNRFLRNQGDLFEHIRSKRKAVR